MSTFKPTLSATIDVDNDPNAISKLKFPVLASPKLDGIRAIVRNGEVVSRSLKPLPRHAVQSAFRGLEGFDGEIIVGNPTDHDVYNRTQSYVMSNDERPIPDFTYFVFDYALESVKELPFVARIGNVRWEIDQCNAEGCDLHDVVVVEQRLIDSAEELLAFEEECLDAGYEGIMTRDPNGKYKHGRSTFKEGLLCKLKRFADEECVVTGFIEQMTNNNVAEKDNLGHTKRSSHAEGMVPADTLGKFLVDFKGMTLEIPCGTFNHAQRKAIWTRQEHFLGKVLKFRHFPHGAKDRPRLPRAIGWRTAEDM